MTTETETTTPLRLMSVEVTNFKRIEYVLWGLRRGLNVIGGANRQGKSSFIDAIELALSGKGKVPPEPIRKGTRKAEIHLKAGDGSAVALSIDVEIRGDGTYKADVRGKDGGAIPGGGVTFVKDLFNREAFDPFRFSRLGATEQDKILKEISGLDFSGNDLATKQLKEAAAATKKQLESANARLKAMPVHTGVPEKETPVSELAEQLEQARTQNHKRQVQAEKVASDERALANAEAAVERAREALRNAEAALTTAKDTLELSRAEPLPELVDVAPLQQAIRDAEGTNQKVRENASRSATAKEVAALERTLDDHKEALEELAERRQKQIESAKFPVPGLSFDEIGPTYQGFPLEQASHSDKLKIGAAIEMARHPGLGLLLVRDGEKHGTEDLKFIEEFALEHGFDVVLEKMTESGEGCHLVLEDGKAKAAEVAAE